MQKFYLKISVAGIDALTSAPSLQATLNVKFMRNTACIKLGIFPYTILRQLKIT